MAITPRSGISLLGKMSCVHKRALEHQYKDNLVGMVVVVKGGPCTGKTTLARALAKSLRGTLVSHEDFLSCTSDTERLLSTCPSIETLPADYLNDLSYEVLWKVAQTQLLRHRSVIVDPSLHTLAHLHRFLAELAVCRSSSYQRNINVMPIIIECQAGDKTEWRRRLLSKKTYSPEETERILKEEGEGEGEEDGRFDTVDIPKLIIDTTAGLEIEEHARNMENFILACLDKKLYGELLISELASGCKDCKMAYVQKITAHLPSTIRHRCHEHELVLCNFARGYAFRKALRFHCKGCGGNGSNLHYSCVDSSCSFKLHAKCALNLPLTATVPSHNWHHNLDPPFVLASRPLDPENCYCDLCEEERDPDVWVYSCQECEYHVHIKCANPGFFQSPELVQYK